MQETFHHLGKYKHKINETIQKSMLCFQSPFEIKYKKSLTLNKTKVFYTEQLGMWLDNKYIQTDSNAIKVYKRQRIFSM